MSDNLCHCSLDPLFLNAHLSTDHCCSTRRLTMVWMVWRILTASSSICCWKWGEEREGGNEIIISRYLWSIEYTVYTPFPHSLSIYPILLPLPNLLACSISPSLSLLPCLTRLNWIPMTTTAGAHDYLAQHHNVDVADVLCERASQCWLCRLSLSWCPVVLCWYCVDLNAFTFACLFSLAGFDLSELAGLE